MKYLSLLAAVAIIYVILARQSPVAEVTKTIAQPELAPLTSGSREVAPQSTALKRPFDRTHEALSAVQKRNGTGEF